MSENLPLLYRMARRMTLDHDLAQDIVAQALMKAAGAWVSFDQRNTRAWLIRILRNEYLMHLRDQSVRPKSGPMPETVGSKDDVVGQVLVKMTNEELLSAIDRLPVEYREAVALCDIEEVGYKEAATIMGVRAGTVASRLHRGRQMLREALAHGGMI